MSWIDSWLKTFSEDRLYDYVTSNREEDVRYSSSPYDGRVLDWWDNFKKRNQDDK